MHIAPVEEAARVADAGWEGQLRMGDRWATWRGAVGDGSLHRHFAAQAVISDRSIRVFDGQGRYVEAECVLIDPLALHRIEPGRDAMLVYLEPASYIDAGVEGLLSPARSASSLALVSPSEGPRFWANWLARPAGAARPADTRLAAALELIERALPFGPVPLPTAAARAALSPDRFRHVFAEQVGLPYRRYVLWRRLRLATTELMAGQDVTRAAHAAGFSDAAHFARTLKTTFGVTAGQALLTR